MVKKLDIWLAGRRSRQDSCFRNENSSTTFTNLLTVSLWSLFEYPVVGGCYYYFLKRFLLIFASCWVVFVSFRRIDGRHKRLTWFPTVFFSSAENVAILSAPADCSSRVGTGIRCERPPDGEPRPLVYVLLQTTLSVPKIVHGARTGRSRNDASTSSSKNRFPETDGSTWLGQ